MVTYRKIYKVLLLSSNMKQVICDKCGKVISEKKFQTDMFGEEFDKLWNSFNQTTERNFDLCPKCKKKFDKVVNDFLSEK